MNKDNIIQKLKKFGLNEIEAKIYLYLLKHGAKSALELSRELDLNRTRIYRYKEKLINKKLIEDSVTKWGKKFKATNPKFLQLVIQQNEDSLKTQKEIIPSLLDDLIKLPNFIENEFEVKHYRKKEGLKQMFWNQLNAKKEILAFSFETKNENAGKKFAEKVRFEQVKRGIKLYELENVDDRGNFWYTDVPRWNEYYDSYPIPKNILEINQIISIFNDTVSIMNSSHAEPVGVEIINSFYAKSMRQMFWEFWKIAKENYSKSK